MQYKKLIKKYEQNINSSYIHNIDQISKVSNFCKKNSKFCKMKLKFIKLIYNIFIDRKTITYKFLFISYQFIFFPYDFPTKTLSIYKNQTNAAKISSIVWNHEIPFDVWLCKNTHECKYTSKRSSGIGPKSRTYLKTKKMRPRKWEWFVYTCCYFFNPFQLLSIWLVVAPVTGSTKLLKQKQCIYICSLYIVNIYSL